MKTLTLPASAYRVFAALIRCEVIDHGDKYGVEALFLDDGFPSRVECFRLATVTRDADHPD